MGSLAGEAQRIGWRSLHSVELLVSASASSSSKNPGAPHNLSTKLSLLINYTPMDDSKIAAHNNTSHIDHASPPKSSNAEEGDYQLAGASLGTLVMEVNGKVVLVPTPSTDPNECVFLLPLPLSPRNRAHPLAKSPVPSTGVRDSRSISQSSPALQFFCPVRALPRQSFALHSLTDPTPCRLPRSWTNCRHRCYRYRIHWTSTDIEHCQDW